MKKTIKIGSRKSLLAVAQTNILINILKQKYPQTDFQLVTMDTSGDRNMKPFSDVTDKFGIKGLFTKELEEALTSGEIDIAVHSLKDIPMTENPQLPIVALSKREDARDASLLPQDIKEYDGGTIGCSSSRRKLQLSNIYKNCKVEPVRGNIITRIKKLDNHEFSMIILAAAGLKRAGMQERINKYFSVDEIIPAPGQGVLACQGKKGTDYSWLEVIKDKETEICVKAERTFSALLGGGCTSPVGAYAEINNNNLILRGFYLDEKTGTPLKGKLTGSINEPEKLAKELATLLSKGEF
ncbi:MAG: hydroxymethylbilane synthase [Synergistaceae bacterium]